MSIISSQKKISKNEVMQSKPAFKLCIITSTLYSSASTNNKVYLTLTPYVDIAFEYYCTLNNADKLGEEYCCDALIRTTQSSIPPSMSIETGSDGLLVDSIGYYSLNNDTNEYEKNFKHAFMQSNSYIQTAKMTPDGLKQEEILINPLTQAFCLYNLYFMYCHKTIIITTHKLILNQLVKKAN